MRATLRHYMCWPAMVIISYLGVYVCISHLFVSSKFCLAGN